MAAAMLQTCLFSRHVVTREPQRIVQPVAARSQPSAASLVPTTSLDCSFLRSILRTKKVDDRMSRFALDRISTERVRLR
jgi:hypothetical protein